MLTVDHYELIRRKHFIDGMNIRAISRELYHSRQKIRKALKLCNPPGNRWQQPVSLPPMAKSGTLLMRGWSRMPSVWSSRGTRFSGFTNG
jgi:hypothetical protein